jgi:hypothetical protein
MNKRLSTVLKPTLAFGVSLGLLAVIAHSFLNPQISHVMVTDSVWGRTELSVLITPENVAHASITNFGRIGFSDGGTQALTRKFSIMPPEVERIRGLTEQAGLFSGQLWGKDERGLDGALVTLQYSQDSKIITVTVTGNDSFSSGSRKELVAFLESIRTRELTRWTVPLESND